MTWISVEDQLPDENQDILVWCGWCITAIYKPKDRSYGPKGKNFDWTTEDAHAPIFMVTHWQPLPEPPKD